MRRFFITSDKFTGTAEIMYSETGWLVYIDLRATNINPAGVNQLVKEIIPVQLSLLPDQMKEYTTLTCVEAEFIVTLEDFKREYPYKRNMHLLPAIWDRMDKTKQVLAWKSAQDYRKYCERKSWYTPKIAAAWLKAEEYLNDWKRL